MMDIACASSVELLMDHLEGMLPAELRSAFDAHVARCPRCVAFIASYCETPRILREATATKLPADVQAALRAFLRAQRRTLSAEE